MTSQTLYIKILSGTTHSMQSKAYRVSHNIGSTLFFAILLASTLPKYKSWVSIKKFRKFATGTKNLKIDLELAEITDVKEATYNNKIIFLRLSNSKMSISK